MSERNFPRLTAEDRLPEEGLHHFKNRLWKANTLADIDQAKTVEELKAIMISWVEGGVVPPANSAGPAGE